MVLRLLKLHLLVIHQAVHLVLVVVVEEEVVVVVEEDQEVDLEVFEEIEI
jgi:hypothetical protein